MRIPARYKTASRSARRKKSAPRGHGREAWGFLLAAAGAAAFYCTLFPAGEWGRLIKGTLSTAFGSTMALPPLWLVYVGLRLAWPRPWPYALLRVACWAAFFFFLSVFNTLLSRLAFHLNRGGAVGLAGAAFVERLFGPAGAWAAAIAGGLLSVCGIFKM